MKALAEIADAYVKAVSGYTRPISEEEMRDDLDLHTGGELDTFALDMLCGMARARLNKIADPDAPYRPTWPQEG